MQHLSVAILCISGTEISGNKVPSSLHLRTAESPGKSEAKQFGGGREIIQQVRLRGHLLASCLALVLVSLSSYSGDNSMHMSIVSNFQSWAPPKKLS